MWLNLLLMETKTRECWILLWMMRINRFLSWFSFYLVSGKEFPIAINKTTKRKLFSADLKWWSICLWFSYVWCISKIAIFFSDDDDGQYQTLVIHHHRIDDWNPLMFFFSFQNVWFKQMIHSILGDMFFFVFFSFIHSFKVNLNQCYDFFSIHFAFDISTKKQR